MINTPERTEATVDPLIGQFVAATKPIHDSYQGQLITIPVGYKVKIFRHMPANIELSQPESFVVSCFIKTGVVKALCSRDDLDLPILLPTETEDDESGLYEDDNDKPLIPRIYQEFAITWQIYACMPQNFQPTRRGVINGDAPGVGKTLQCGESAHRVMMAMRANKDPLSYCYLQHFEKDPEYTLQLEKNADQQNPHPVYHPSWALPHNVWPYPDTTCKPCTVVVAPRHLAKQWFKHLARQYPQDSISLATSASSTRKERLWALRPGFDWYIVNYEMLRPASEPKDEDYEVYDEPVTYLGQTYQVKQKRLKSTYTPTVTFFDQIMSLNPVCTIYDECHRLKSSQSKQAKQAAKLSQTALFNFLASATTISREADDMWHQLHIIDQSNFSSFKNFYDDFCMYENTSYGKRDVQLRTFAKRLFWVNRVGDDASMPGLAISTYNKTYLTSFARPNLKGYVLGRSYSDVGMYLPPVIAVTIPVQMETSTRKIYDSTRDMYRANFENLGETVELTSLMAVLHCLRFLTAASQNKIEAIQQLIQDNEGPHVIFCAYDLPCDNLARMLGTKSITGAVKTTEERNQIIQYCLSNNLPIVATGGTIGEGVNGLEQAKVVIFSEEDYTPGKMYQRTSRVQRFDPNLKEGETKTPILVFYVHCVDSIDERVHMIQTNRSMSIKDVIAVELGV